MSNKGVRRGGGSSPIQKISLQIDAYITDFLEKAQCNFQKRTGEGVEAVWKFSKKTSTFAPKVAPKIALQKLFKWDDLSTSE